MTLKINYLDNKKISIKNRAIFINQDINSSAIKEQLEGKIYKNIQHYLKTNKSFKKEDKIISLNRDFEEKLIIIFISKSKNELDFEKLGAKFYEFIKKNEINDIFIHAPTFQNSKINNLLIFNSFLHGAELKSYEFNLYKTNNKTKKISFNILKNNVSKQAKKFDAILDGVNFTKD